MTMVRETTDIELMTLIRERRDPAALEQLYHRYKRRLMGFFYQMVWDKSAAEDLLQEVFIKLWNSADQYRASGLFSTYLFQIAKNHWLNAKDKMDRRPKPVSLDEKKTPPGTMLTARR